MTIAEALERYLAAWRADDHAAIQAVLLEVDDESFDELVVRVSEAVGDGAGQPSAVPLDPERLHSALRASGFGAGDALRLSQLAAGDPAGYLEACRVEAGIEVSGVATAVVRGLDALGPADEPSVRRYVGRIFDGRHDVRRVADTALGAVAEAVSASRVTILQLRDSLALPAAGPALAAARSAAADPAFELVEADAAPPSAVDELFCGRPTE